MELLTYPSVIGKKIEIKIHTEEGLIPNIDNYSPLNGVIKKEIRDIQGYRYFIVELTPGNDKIRFIMITERYKGASIPRELPYPNRSIFVGIGILKDPSLAKKDVFEFDEVDYVAIGEVKLISD